jgi:hypothetical protein
MDFFRNVLLVLASISFIVVIGGAVYEHLALVPVWSAAVPASLTAFQGEYRITPEKFWMLIHPVTIVLLLAALLLHWKTPRRAFVLSPLVGYAIILIVTFFYFVPELLALTQSTYSATVDPELTVRAGRWETLSLIRLLFLIILALILLFGLTKPVEFRRRMAY